MENFVYFAMGITCIALAVLLAVIAYKEFKDYM